MKKIAVIDIGSNSVRLMTKDIQTKKFVSMTQLGKRSSNLSTSFWQTRLERNHQDVPLRHALTSMTCFTRLPEDTALSKDG